VAFYGPFPYAYSGIIHAARSLPPVIEALRGRIEETAGQPFNTVLMNLYRSGSDSVSWHSDDDYPHGGHPAVASLSLRERLSEQVMMGSLRLPMPVYKRLRARAVLPWIPRNGADPGT
jgi:2OG-Fe(II) oxygenase superfamily